jgi:hypothetical protein
MPLAKHLPAAGVLVLTAMLLLTRTACAEPPRPFSPYGTVMIDGANVPVGVPVGASCGGVVYASQPVFIVGDESWYALNVPGDDPSTTSIVEGCDPGETVNFTVVGLSADQTAAWISGGTLLLPLTASKPTPTMTVTPTSTPTGTLTPTPSATPSQSPMPGATSSPTVTGTAWMWLYLPLILDEGPVRASGNHELRTTGRPN